MGGHKLKLVNLRASVGQKIAHPVLPHAFQKRGLQVDQQKALFVCEILLHDLAIRPYNQSNSGKIEPGAVITDLIAGSDKHAVVKGSRR